LKYQPLWRPAARLPLDRRGNPNLPARARPRPCDDPCDVPRLAGDHLHVAKSSSVPPRPGARIMRLTAGPPGAVTFSPSCTASAPPTTRTTAPTTSRWTASHPRARLTGRAPTTGIPEHP
jgi:hypothetical protein